MHPNDYIYFFGSWPYCGYGSGFGAGIKTGLRGFVIPMVRKSGFPVAKLFLQQSATEILNIFRGGTDLLKNAVKKTIRKQIDDGRHTYSKSLALRKTKTTKGYHKN